MTSPLQNKTAGYGEEQTDPSWRIFRIMAEFVDGFTFLSQLRNTVTFFGSARLKEDNRYYKLARDLGARLAHEGFTVVTGGGPGIMEAGNRGAQEAGGVSVGLNIQLPMEQRVNPYVTHSASFHYFFSRKVMLDFSAQAYVFFPGGFGTMDEFFELITLRQTGKIHGSVPIVLIGKEFWSGLLAWMSDQMFERGMIKQTDLAVWTLTDDLDEAVRIISDAARRQAEQNIDNHPNVPSAVIHGLAAPALNTMMDAAITPATPAITYDPKVDQAAMLSAHAEARERTKTEQ